MLVDEVVLMCGEDAEVPSHVNFSPAWVAAKWDLPIFTSPCSRNLSRLLEMLLSTLYSFHKLCIVS